MIQEEKSEFGVGKWWTADGRPAVVDAVVDGMLVGRIDIATKQHLSPTWFPCLWHLDGNHHNGGPHHRLRADRRINVKRTYWVNIYDNGPGLLRNTWEESLIEASREEKQPLCRVEVKVDSYVGEGFK